MSKSHRVFFALWPDDQLRQQIMRAFEQAPLSRQHGRVFKPGNLHLTLRFLGQVDVRQLGCIQAAAAQVKASPITLELSRFGYFQRAKVFWLGMDTLPDTLDGLYRDLSTALEGCGFAKESRAFNPHITLMRKFHPASLHKEASLELKSPIVWRAQRFALVESISVHGGVEYRPNAWFDLGV